MVHCAIYLALLSVVNRRLRYSRLDFYRETPFKPSPRFRFCVDEYFVRALCLNKLFVCENFTQPCDHSLLSLYVFVFRSVIQQLIVICLMIHQ